MAQHENIKDMSRYERQTALAEIGIKGQEAFHNAKVLISGAGGLGSPLSLYLAATGIGTIGIADFDTVSEPNLQRQILYNESDIDKPKAGCAAEKLRQLNSGIKVVAHNCKITAENAEEIISQYDIVADACDNFATRYVLNDTCLKLGKPYVYGAVRGFEGQVSVFGYGEHPRSYRELYPDEEELVNMTPYRRVVAPIPGVTGSVQASEIMKIICNCGEPLTGRLWTINLLDMQTNIIGF